MKLLRVLFVALAIALALTKPPEVSAGVGCRPHPLNEDVIDLVPVGNWPSGRQWSESAYLITKQLKEAFPISDKWTFRVYPNAIPAGKLNYGDLDAQMDVIKKLNKLELDGDLIIAAVWDDYAVGFWPVLNSGGSDWVPHCGGIAFVPVYGFPNERIPVGVHEVAHYKGITEDSGGVMNSMTFNTEEGLRLTEKQKEYLLTLR